VGTAGLSCALAVSASNSAQDAISSLRKGMAIPGLFVRASLLATESERKQPSPAACLVGTLASSMDRDLPQVNADRKHRIFDLQQAPTICTPARMVGYSRKRRIHSSHRP